MHHAHMAQDIPGLVRSLRKKKKWLQRDMAEATGWDQAKISRIERGRAEPSVDDLATIARVFRYPIGRLVALRVAA